MEYPDEAEGYWGLILCKYGIEYVDDPTTGKKMPTCHRFSYDCVMDDPDYDMVMKYADSESREIYLSEAKTIPILKKMVHKVITAIEKVKNITDQVKEHVTRTRVSFKERLAISKKEADRRNAERQAAEREKGMVRKPEKSGPAL